jgi:hypothetical protein
MTIADAPSRPLSVPRAVVLLVAIVTGFAATQSLAQTDTYKPGQKSQPKQKQPSKKKSERLEKEGRELFGGGGNEKPTGAAAAAYWSIVLVSFREGEQDVEAQRGLERVRNLAGLKDAYLEKRGPATVIAYGRYETQAAGEKDLAKIRKLSVTEGGVTAQPFSTAMLAPPAEIRGSMPEYDLRNVRQQKDWAAYTLQVGVYGRIDGPPTAKELAEFRAAAEKAAVQLRREGEEAYYVHGPNKSMVTIGVFSLEDFDSQTRFEAPQITQLRKRYPYNLLNGQGVRNSVKITDPKTGKVVRQQQLQKSALINIPKE